MLEFDLTLPIFVPVYDIQMCVQYNILYFQ